MVTLDDPAVRAAYEDEESLPRMSFGDHLDELRSRLIKSLLAIVVAILAMVPFKEGVQDIVLQPYRVQWRRGFEQHVAELEVRAAAAAADPAVAEADPLAIEFLQFTREHHDRILAGTFKDVHVLANRTGFHVPYTLAAVGGLEDLWVFFMASLVFAFVLAAPVVVWQAWAFVASGLYPRERRMFRRYFPFTIGLLAAGVLFGYVLALPLSLGFLIALMKPDQVQAMLTVGQYFTLAFGMTAAMGLVFLLPLVMVALQRVGIVRHKTFRRNWRMFVLVLFLGAAVFTPPDPFSMLLMATPMLLLYGLGLLLTRLGQRHEHPFDVAADAATTEPSGAGRA